ncbi:MAG: hypothetical protein GX100_08650 [candidate division WS1 bacterium]|nr:hypothetical protein [candidate division WS1 bacterium]
MTSEIEEAAAAVVELTRTRPEKNMLAVYEEVMVGRRPSGCPVYLGRVQHWTEVPGESREAPQGFRPDEEVVLGALRNIPKALEMENPFTPALSVGFGVPTVATAFGAEIDFSPRNPGGVVAYLALESFDDLETPNIKTAGVFPRIKQMIEFIRANTPPEIKILFPDLQGPINVAHLLLGTDLFLAMHDQPERVHGLLQRITEFLIQCFKTLPEWIGPERMVSFPGNRVRIAECSVNLISRDGYREFGLPYDCQIAEALGEIAIHPCGGLHVFEETLAGLPNVVYTEWSDCKPSIAPRVTLEAALERIGDRPIILSGGKELWEGDFAQQIKNDLARLEDHSRQTFGYSGMRWRSGEEARIVALHREVDAYYEARYS